MCYTPGITAKTAVKVHMEEPVFGRKGHVGFALLAITFLALGIIGTLIDAKVIEASRYVYQNAKVFMVTGFAVGPPLCCIHLLICFVNYSPRFKRKDFDCVIEFDGVKYPMSFKEVHLHVSNLLEDLEDIASQIPGVSNENISLEYKGKVLSGDDLFDDFDVKNGDTLKLVIKPPLAAGVTAAAPAATAT